MDTKDLVTCYMHVRESSIVANTNSISNQNRPNAMKIGTLQLVDPQGQVLGTYQFRNGGGGRGFLPNGTYTVTAKEPLARDDVNGMTIDGIGYKYRVRTTSGEEQIPDPRYPEQPRTGILIHPDGGYPGTNGCIGIVGNGKIQKDFMQKLDNLMQQNGGQYTFQFDSGGTISQQPSAGEQPSAGQQTTIDQEIDKLLTHPMHTAFAQKQSLPQSPPVTNLQQLPTPVNKNQQLSTRPSTYKQFVQTRKQLSGRGY